MLCNLDFMRNKLKAYFRSNGMIYQKSKRQDYLMILFIEHNENRDKHQNGKQVRSVMSNGLNAVLPKDYKRLAHTSPDNENNGYEESQRKMWVKYGRARIQGDVASESYRITGEKMQYRKRQVPNRSP